MEVEGEGRGVALAFPERSEGERSETERSGGKASAGRASVPAETEVLAKAQRRRFTAEYKLRIVAQADACRELGEVGALLRREGLYSSHLTAWRKQVKHGVLRSLGCKKRGRKPIPVNPLARRTAELERENRKLRRRLQQAETIIEFQKKVSELLGIPLNRPERDGSD
jgi:transposase-like protein